MSKPSDYLNQLSNELGVPPEQVMDSFVQNEYHYGLTASIGGIIVFWTVVFFARYFFTRYKQQRSHESFEILMFIALVAAFFTLIFTANAVHHILAPEGYAMKDLYNIVVNKAWSGD